MKYILSLILILITTVAAANTYTNDNINGQQINLQTNKYGYTTGTIGNKQVYIHTTPNGYTNGTIGGQQYNTYTNPQ